MLPFPPDVDAPRYLPPYEETTIPYSMRLPTYRSSYIRRFHPYARYITSTIEDSYHTDNVYRDSDEEPLDLSILEQRAAPPPENPDVPSNDLHSAIIGPDDSARELPEASEGHVIVIIPIMIKEGTPSVKSSSTKTSKV